MRKEYSLGVADVQVAIGLRRETRDGGLVFARREVLRDDLADEVLGFGGVGHGGSAGGFAELFEQRLIESNTRFEVLDREVLVGSMNLGVGECQPKK